MNIQIRNNYPFSLFRITAKFIPRIPVKVTGYLAFAGNIDFGIRGYWRRRKHVFPHYPLKSLYVAAIAENGIFIYGSSFIVTTDMALQFPVKPEIRCTD
jgi:hypothetical protein